MMAEYIEREAAIELLHYNADETCSAVVCDFEAIPTADVAPVVHGQWVKNNDSFQTDDYYCCYFDYSCSECGAIVNDRYKLPNYCPNCGAKMDGGGDDKR